VVLTSRGLIYGQWREAHLVHGILWRGIWMHLSWAGV
jgi:hypothetical protein